MADARAMPALSVLDHTPVSDEGDLGDAFRHSTELAQLAERLGYRRYWVAEHHGRPWMAGSSPPVLMAHVAASTSTIAVGSGALLLGNSSPLAVAEQFGLLAALHPGRIDLGIGRSSGADAVATHALRGREVDVDRSLGELLAFFAGSFPEEHPYHRITAVPGEGTAPSIWLCGSGTHSARVAGRLGLPFVHGGHFAADAARRAIATYREAFEPSAVLAEPYVGASVGVLCADTDEDAQAANALAVANLSRGLVGAVSAFRSGEALAADPRSVPSEVADHVRRITATHVVGGPETVRRGLGQIAGAWGVDELFVTTLMHGYAARLRSYELVARPEARAS